MKITNFCLIFIIMLNFVPSLASGEEISSINTKGTPQDSSKALTLEECYALALKQSETIAINADLIKESEARFLQAMSGLLPHVTFSASENKQDVTSSSLGSGSVRKFVFKQTLFAGFKEFAAVSGSKFEKNQRLNEKKRAEQLLFTDVSDSFYLLIEQKEDFKVLETTETVLNERIKELKQREDLGRSRRSEVVNAESQLYGVQAEMELVKSHEAVARQLLEFLTGRAVDKVIDSENILPSLNTEDYYISKTNMRPDVQAANQAGEVAKKEVAVARAVFFPTLSAEANYYTYRTSPPTDSNWDAALKLDLPIFQGTEHLGEVKQAMLKAHEAGLSFSRTKRLAVQDISDSYVKLQAAILRNKALKKALDSSEMNYNLQKEDYSLNLVNNLDVLTSIQLLEEARRNFIHSLYETKRLYGQLTVATGEIK